MKTVTSLFSKVFPLNIYLTSHTARPKKPNKNPKNIWVHAPKTTGFIGQIPFKNQPLNVKEYLSDSIWQLSSSSSHRSQLGPSQWKCLPKKCTINPIKPQNTLGALFWKHLSFLNPNRE